MDELDFSAGSKPAQPGVPSKPVAPSAPDILYDPNVAYAFFKNGGKDELVAGGKLIFEEDEKSGGGLFGKSARMYLLVEGLVGLMAKGEFLTVLRPGEIFGEMGVVGGLPRTATAKAQTACKLVSMDNKAFQGALAKAPEFALMLMSMMVNRLRALMAKPGGVTPNEVPSERNAVFDKKLMAELHKALADRPPMEVPPQKAVIAAGAAGIMMYVLLEGSVDIVVGNTVVERIGSGGLFGEMALVDRSARAASAIAQTDCKLLALNRNDFLALVRSNPAFGASLLKAIAERTSAIVKK